MGFLGILGFEGFYIRVLVLGGVGGGGGRGVFFFFFLGGGGGGGGGGGADEGFGFRVSGLRFRVVLLLLFL